MATTRADNVRIGDRITVGDRWGGKRVTGVVTNHGTAQRTGVVYIDVQHEDSDRVTVIISKPYDTVQLVPKG